MTEKPEFIYRFKPLQKYFKHDWYPDIVTYLKIRYPPVVNRLKNSFRYVDFHPDNKAVFSYEYASILRDIGSTFSSVLDSFVRRINNEPDEERQYNISDYTKFLLSKISNLNDVVVILNTDYKEKYVFPFQGFDTDKTSSVWWNAYNKVKHTDIYSMQKGCLSNVIYGFSALTVIYDSIIHIPKYDRIDITGNIIYRIIDHPQGITESVHFPQVLTPEPVK